MRALALALALLRARHTPLSLHSTIPTISTAFTASSRARRERALAVAGYVWPVNVTRAVDAFSAGRAETRAGLLGTTAPRGARSREDKRGCAREVERARNDFGGN